MMKVLSVGPVYVDMNCLEFPVGQGLMPEIEARGGPYEVVPGGSATNFAKSVRQLGAEVTLFSKVGEDIWADFLGTRVRGFGVVPVLLRGTGALTDVGINFVSSDGHRAMAVVGTAAKEWQPSELQAVFEEHVGLITHLYIGGALKMPQLIPELIQIVKICIRRRIVTTMDHGRFWPDVPERDVLPIRDLATLVDIYLPSRKEFLTVWGGDDVDIAAKRYVRTAGESRTLVVKGGAVGAVAFRGQERVLKAAYPTNLRNTVGAGDCFNACFVIAQSCGYDLSESTEFAICGASLWIANNVVPTVDDINRLRLNMPQLSLDKTSR